MRVSEIRVKRIRVNQGLGVLYFSTSKKVRGIFLIIKIRVIFAVKCFLKIEIFWGHEVLKLHFKYSKKSISWNIMAPKYPFFNEELNFLVQNVYT